MAKRGRTGALIALALGAAAVWAAKDIPRQMGGKAKGDRLARVLASPPFAGGKFRNSVPAADFAEQAKGLAGRFVTLRTQDGRRLDRLSEYANTKECRAVYLRRYFGEDDGTPCGLCDICRDAPERPSTFYQPIARPERPKKKRRRRRRRGRVGQTPPQPQHAHHQKQRPGRAPAKVLSSSRAVAPEPPAPTLPLPLHKFCCRL